MPHPGVAKGLAATASMPINVIEVKTTAAIKRNRANVTFIDISFPLVLICRMKNSLLSVTVTLNKLVLPRLRYKKLPEISNNH